MAESNVLRLWQERLKKSEAAYASELAKMDGREALYRGVRAVKPLVEGDKTVETRHVRNLCAELIEAEVDSSIPQPKVTARHKEDEPKAKLIEDMLRGELDRLRFEEMNDIADGADSGWRHLACGMGQHQEDARNGRRVGSEFYSPEAGNSARRHIHRH